MSLLIVCLVTKSAYYYTDTETWTIYTRKYNETHIKHPPVTNHLTEKHLVDLFSFFSLVQVLFAL